MSTNKSKNEFENYINKHKGKAKNLDFKNISDGARRAKLNRYKQKLELAEFDDEIEEIKEVAKRGMKHFQHNLAIKSHDFTQVWEEALLELYGYLEYGKLYEKADNLLTPQQGKVKTQQANLADIKNNFDHKPINEVYDYFRKELVKDNHFLTDDQLRQWLKLAFDKQTPPKEKFDFKNDAAKGIIRNVFHTYYVDNIKGRKDKGREKTVRLLTDFFIGFSFESTLTNFSK